MSAVITPTRPVAEPRPKVRPKLITGEELLAMGDIGPCELIDGRIVPMAPTRGKHGVLEITLGWHLRSFVVAHQLGRVLGGEVGIYTHRNPDRVRGADLAFLSNERLVGQSLEGFLDVAPDLVVEIMSPDDRWREVRQKLTEYFRIGVRWVWVIEPESRAVLVYRSVNDVHELKEGDILTGEGSLEGFALPVASLFEE
jgi:Uma2 family endonuclease